VKNAFIFISSFLLIAVSCACTPLPPIPEPEPLPTPQIPEGYSTYDACAYIIHFPQTLTYEVNPENEDTILRTQDNDVLHIRFSARELAADERNHTLAHWLEDASSRQAGLASWSYSPVDVIDVNGVKIPGLRGDAVVKGKHNVVLVAVHRDVYFGDTVSTAVLYTITAQVQEGQWSQWRDDIDLILGTFSPIDCGPY
jgi:hypothetical protein